MYGVEVWLWLCCGCGCGCVAAVPGVGMDARALDVSMRGVCVDGGRWIPSLRLLPFFLVPWFVLRFDLRQVHDIEKRSFTDLFNTKRFPNGSKLYQVALHIKLSLDTFT